MFESVPQAPAEGTIGEGIKLTLLLHLIQIPLGIVTLLIAPIFVGVSQLVYMLPAIFIARKHNETAKAQGLIIGVSVIFLLNAACWGVMGITMSAPR